MQERQIRIAVVLASLLAVLLLLDTWWQPPATVIDPDATEAIWSVKADDVVRLQIDRPDGRVVLVREGDAWSLVEPIAERAEQVEARYLVQELERVELGMPIPDAVDPAEFGLGDPPLVRATVTTAEGEIKTLDIGRETAVGWRTYVRAADGSIVAVAGIVGKRLQIPIDELRDPTLMDFDLASVRRVTLASFAGTLTVFGEGAEWWVEGWTRANNDAIDDLIVGLRDMRFDSFFQGEPPKSIGDPLSTVTIETTEGTYGFRVGEVGPMGHLVRTEAGRVGFIGPEKLALLGQGPKDVGAATAFPIDPSSSDRVVVAGGLGDLDAVRGEDGWGDDFEKVRALALVPIFYRMEPGPPLSETWGTVTVYTGVAVRTIEIGQQIEGLRVARDTAGGSPFFVPVEALPVL